ncbi:MAG: hypothetical protein IIB65_09805 [Proteobacteria bacterium]|nr:hypothetical protein [Pseudomonadota bacterium]
MAVTPVRRGPPHRPRRNLFPELTVRRNLEQNARSALAVSDDGIVLEQGRLALAGSADEILADRRVGALFLGGGVGSGKNANSAFCRLRAMLTQKLFSRSTDNLIQIFSVTA